MQATLERERLVERHRHPTHGRILQVALSDEGRRRLGSATLRVPTLERDIEAGLTEEEPAVVKRWLVTAARVAAGTGAPDPR